MYRTSADMSSYCTETNLHVCNPCYIVWLEFDKCPIVKDAVLHQDCFSEILKIAKLIYIH
jgi:hypothetical protein